MGEEEQLHLEWRKGVTDNLSELSDDNKKITSELIELSIKFERSNFAIEALVKELKLYREGANVKFTEITKTLKEYDFRISKLEIFKIKLVVAFTIIQTAGLIVLNYFGK